MNFTDAERVQQGVGDRARFAFLVGATATIVGISEYLYHREDPKRVAEDVSLLPYAEDIAIAVPEKYEAVVVGGLPIDAFNDKESLIDVSGKSITVTDTFSCPLLRKNNTVRDYDVLIFGRTSEGRLQRVSDVEQKVIKTELKKLTRARADKLGQPAPEMSVFSFDDSSSLVYSSTKISENGGLALEQGFVKQSLPDNAMETWDLILPDGQVIKILNPWEQYWRSKVRFASGAKQKDVEKLDVMINKLRTTPDLAELESDPLSVAYWLFQDRMLAQNKLYNAFDMFMRPDESAKRALAVGKLAIASHGMRIGQSSQLIQKFVQSTPAIFNHFVGSK